MINILVAGPGCRNCEKLAEMCRNAVAELNIDADITKVTDYNQITDLGIMMTPGLIINGEIKLSGKLPAMATLKNWITEAESN